MLTRATPSRRRLVAGTTAVGGLVAAGLGVTASGTRAAAAVTERIGTAVGVDLAQAVPPVPPVPVAPAAPSAPAAPTAPAAPRHVTVIRTPGTPHSFVVAPGADGKPTRILSADGGAVPANLVNVNITAGDCGPDKGGKTFIVRRPASGGEATVICTDRITTAAMKGQMSEADGDNIERQALTSALTGLRNSRANVVGNASMTAEARTEALAGIDEAIKEVEGDLADVGKDD